MQKRITSMPINIERPRSALLRGVRITEFKGHIINPDPILLQETDFLLEEFLSPTKLKALTGVNDLSNVKHLEMIVDTSETSLGNFGIYLPNLKQLKLNGSFVPRIRDLGTSLTHLKVIWLSRSGLIELDGFPTLSSLEEVYLAYNEITDISPCSMLDNLKCLDLEGNLIDDMKQVEFLNLCSKLENLTLYGNPICVKSNPDTVEEDPFYSYRHEVIKVLPDLKVLDDELTLNTKPLSPIKTLTNSMPHKNYQKPTFSHECPFDDDWQLINQFIAEGIGPSEDKLAINESLRPGTSSSRGSRPNTSIRPLSAMRPLSSYRNKTSAVQERPSSRLMSSASNSNIPSRLSTTEKSSSSEQISDILIDSSSLTVGPTFQGNPLKALLARKKTTSSNFLNETDQPTVDSIKKSESTTLTLSKAIQKLELNESSLNNKELRSELNIWKKDHARKLEERKQYFEPQVLKIEDDADENKTRMLSDNDEANTYSYYDEYHEIKNPNECNESFSNEINNLISPRLNQQSASRKSLNEINSELNEQIKFKEKRSKSKFRSKSRSNRLDDDLVRLNSHSSNRAINREDSDLSSRVETGDTGYASFSSLSVSSLSSITDKFSNHSHQPIIVSNLIKTPMLQQHQLQSLTKVQSPNTLKQLKTNLMPLSANYLQKK